MQYLLRYHDLQMNPYVSDLALYDIQGTPGVAADISHINSKAKTKVSTPAFAFDSRPSLAVAYMKALLLIDHRICSLSSPF